MKRAIFIPFKFPNTFQLLNYFFYYNIMGCSEIYCALCGCPILQKSTILQLCKEKIYKKSDIDWLKDCYSLLSNNTLYKKAIVEDCDEHFDETEYKLFSHKYRFSQILEVHKLCYNIIQDETGIKLKYSDFMNSSRKKSMYLLDYVDYGLIEKYTKQEFIWNMQELANNKKLRELLLNPLKNKENKTRLLKIFKQFKIKPDRKGPNISATLFKNNTYLIGNDNSLWKIENKRWTKVETITERIKFNKNLIPNLEKMSAIGSYNMNGVCYNIINGGKNSPTFVTFYKIFDK
jgi:hypothetical protein